MDNDKANDLIDAVGGLNALNSWLDARGYSSTRFGHRYGDVETAGLGYQNTTSSDDAAKMLTAMITKGDDGLLTYDVTTDGVNVPSGATVHAHRGMGVGDAYDYYMVVSNGSRKVAVRGAHPEPVQEAGGLPDLRCASAGLVEHHAFGREVTGNGATCGARDTLGPARPYPG